MNDVEALAQLHELYAELPKLQCKGMCANSCGPIDMTDVERRRLVDLGYEIPVFTPEAGRAWAAGERLDCPALNLQLRTCKVYKDRPLICRLWGLAESMPCVWGCRPERMLTDVEAYDLLGRAMEIGGHRRFAQNAREMRQFREVMAEYLDDPELGPLFARFVRGDQTVEPEIIELIAQRRRA